MNKLILLLILSLISAVPPYDHTIDSLIIKDRSEIISPKTVKINNVPFHTSPKQLVQLLFKPDSIVPIEVGCGSYFENTQSGTYYYYGRTSFEIYKQDAVLKRLILTDGIFKFHIKDIVLDNHTSLSEIAQLFPKSFGDSYDWKDNKSKKTYHIVWIDPFPDADDKWLLWFYKNKLVEIEYRVQC